MKKKLFLVNYEFMTGENKYSAYKHVTVKFDKTMPEQKGMDLATSALMDWFNRTHPESELGGVTISAALEVTYKPNADNSAVKDYVQSLRDLRFKKDDGYSAEMPLDRIQQLVVETAPYTDRLILNGLADLEVIKHFQDAGCYCDIMKDSTDGSNYTVIKWSK